MRGREEPFRLAKWYLDAVTDDGEVFIAYHAQLTWRRLAVRWASLLSRAPGGEATTASTLRGGAPPERDGACVRLRSRALFLSGTWEGLDPPYEAELLGGRDGRVLWRCVAPRARVAFTPADGRPRSGLGYAEELELTVAPWKLPIDELLWGRFTSDAGSLVWIEWRGKEPRRLVLRDGSVVEHAQIEDGAVLLRGGERLSLAERVTLRDGRIGRTVLAAIPGARDLPGALLAAEETKWLSRGTLTDGRAVSSGWAIHERVRFR